MKTKKLFLLALFFLSIGQIWAQEQKPYKPAATFKGDTLQYLEYNYTIRSAQYEGKTVGEVLSDLEYPILYVAGMYRIGLHDSNFVSQLMRLSLYIRQTGNKPNELKDYYINLFFENPPTVDEYREASGFSNNNLHPEFSQKLYDFLKDLKVSSVGSNEHILRDPEVLRIRQEKYKKIKEETRELEAVGRAIMEKELRRIEAEEKANKAKNLGN